MFRELQIVLALLETVTSTIADVNTAVLLPVPQNQSNPTVNNSHSEPNCGSDRPANSTNSHCGLPAEMQPTEDGAPCELSGHCGTGRFCSIRRRCISVGNGSSGSACGSDDHCSIGLWCDAAKTNECFKPHMRNDQISLGTPTSERQLIAYTMRSYVEWHAAAEAPNMTEVFLPKRGHAQIHWRGQMPFRGEGASMRVSLTRSDSNRSSPSISAYIVESRCHDGLGVAISSALINLPQSSTITLYHPSENAKFVSALPSRVPALLDPRYRAHEFVLVGDVDPSLLYTPNYWYSRFLTSPDLWRAATTDFVLVFQEDTVICSKLDPGLVFKYPYLGGISDGFDYEASAGALGNGSLDETVELEPSAHLNGGLSMHNATWSAECAEAHQDVLHIEDNLWNMCRPPVKEADAVMFASDNGYTTCFTLSDGSRRCPWGVHKPWQKADVSELARGCASIIDSRAAWEKESTCGRATEGLAAAERERLATTYAFGG